jgi:hypothetical protein
VALLVRLAQRYCADCDMDCQFGVGFDLITRGPDSQRPGRAAGRSGLMKIFIRTAWDAPSS